MEKNEEFDSDFSKEDVPISKGFWNYMENYWHNNREFPESTESSLNKKADLVDGKVPASQLPSYVDDVLEFDSFGNLPNPGEKGKIYLVTNDNSQFRWSDSGYIQLNSDEFLMTTNTHQAITGRKEFITQAGNTWDKNSLMALGTNGSKAGMTFYSHGMDVGQMNFDGYFNFKDANDDNFRYIKGRGFIKENSNDDYLLTGAGGHINKHTKEDSYFHSGRNFTEGTLIKTTVDYSVDYGHQFFLEMKGNMYSGNLPLEMKVQGYIYYRKIISERGYSTYPDLKVITAMNLDGKLCFWFPRLGYWQGFSVKVTIGYGGLENGINRVTAVEDSPDPQGTKRVEIYIDTLATQEWTNSKPYNDITDENINNWNNTFDHQAMNVTLDDKQNITGQKNFSNSIPLAFKSTDKKSWAVHKPLNDNLIIAPSQSLNGEDWDWANQINLGDNGSITSNGYIKNNSNDDYILLGGGSHKAITDFATPGDVNGKVPYVGATQDIELNNKSIYYAQKLHSNGSHIHGNLGLSVLTDAIGGYVSNPLIKIGAIAGNMITFTVKLYSYPYYYYEFQVNIYIYQNNVYEPRIIWRVGESAHIDRIEFFKDTNTGLFYIRPIISVGYPRLAITDVQGYGGDGTFFNENWSVVWGGDTTPLLLQGTINSVDFSGDSRVVNTHKTQEITARKVINKDLGTNEYIGVAQHNAQFQVGRTSDAKSLEFAVTDDGTSYIQSKEAGVGYHPLILNRNNSGGVSIGGTPVTGQGLTVNGSIYSVEGYHKAGADNNSVLLAGGGDKAISEFSLIGHTHNSLENTNFYQNQDTNNYLEAGKMKYTPAVLSTSANMFPNYHNANAIVSISTWSDTAYGHDLGFSGDGNIYHRHRNTDGVKPWFKVLTDFNTSLNDFVTLNTEQNIIGRKTYKTSGGNSDINNSLWVKSTDIGTYPAISFDVYGYKQQIKAEQQSFKFVGSDGVSKLDIVSRKVVADEIQSPYMGSDSLTGNRVIFGSGDGIRLGNYSLNTLIHEASNHYWWNNGLNTYQMILDANGLSIGIGIVSSNGFVKTGSDNTKILLGGGGDKLISDFATQEWVSANFSNQTLSTDVEGLGGQTLTLSNGNTVTITNNFVTSPDGTRNPNDVKPNTSGNRVRFDFANASSVKGSGNYAGVMTYSPWDGTTASTGDSSYQLAFANQTGINGEGIPMLKLRKGIDDNWSSDWYKMWSEGDFSQSDINNWNNIANTAATQSWVQSQNYAPYDFVEAKIDELKGEIVDPAPAFAIKNEFTTVILTDNHSGNPLELEGELIPESFISIINLSKKEMDLNRDGKTIDRIYENETSEYYISKEGSLIKKGTYKSAQVLI